MSNLTVADNSNTKSLFANRFVQSILLSSLFLQMGIWVRNFAILLFVTEQTNKDPVAISLISVAEFAPIFLFSFIGGAFADRWRPKRTMVLCDILSAVSVFAVLLALIYGGWQTIFFATLVSSFLSQFSQPSGMKLFKIHVPAEMLQMGMSMYQTINAIFTILGPMLGTVIYFKFGINTSIAIMGACFLLSAAVLAFIPADKETGTAANANLSQDMKMGFQYVLSNKVFIYMGSFFLLAGMAAGLTNPMGIFLVTEQLSLSAQSLQWFTAINGAGMFIGGVLAMGLAKKLTPQIMLMAGFIFAAMAMLVLAFTNIIPLALLAMFLFGSMMPFIHIACNTLVLSNAEEAFVGRVNGILNPLFTGGMVLNLSLAGILKDQFSLAAIYMAASGLFLLGALTMLPLLKLKHDKNINAAHIHHH